MSQINFASITDPVSSENPCGVDLDREGKAEFTSFLTLAVGRLPGSYFAFDRKSIDFQADDKKIAEFLDQTRDIRLLVLASKLFLLNRKLSEFCHSLVAIADLLEQRWDDVHPTDEDGDFSLRLGTLFTLADRPVVILPLQYCPLLKVPRLGDVTFRSYLVAINEIDARDGEKNVDINALQTGLNEVNQDEFTAVYDLLLNAQEATKRIVSVCQDRIEEAAPLSLDLLDDLLGRMLAFMHEAQPENAPVSSDSGLQEGQQEDTADASESSSFLEDAIETVGSFSDVSDARAALEAVEHYFSSMEPSSPSLFLVRQSRDLVGKSFIEAMRALQPKQLESAAFRMGRDPVKLPLGQLEELQAGSRVNDSIGEDSEPEANGSGQSNNEFKVHTRQDALAHLKAVESFYRAAEPSSPIPMLIEHARQLASKDFLSLIAELKEQTGKEKPEVETQ